MTDCIFCKIARGDERASLVYEDELCFAIMDYLPMTAGHVLIIPKQHASLLNQLDPVMQAHLTATVSRIRVAVNQSGIPCDAAHILLNDGKAAFQSVAHVHFHIIPRCKGDFFRFVFRTSANLFLEFLWNPIMGHKTRRDILDEHAAKIRACLNQA